MDTELFSDYTTTYHVINPIHPEETWIAYHPYSLSLFEIDEKTGRLLKLMEYGLSSEIAASKLNLSMTESKRIMSEFFEVISDKKPKEYYYSKTPDTLWFLNSGSCNMKCSYCYASQGSYGDNSLKLMSKRDAKQAIDLVFSSFPNIDRVHFFGGEPLLNINVIEFILNYIEDQGFDVIYAINTNATLITKHLVDLFKNYKIRPTISIDGPRLVNDYHRVMNNGAGSYDTIVKYIQLLKDNEIIFSIEATYTHEAIILGYSMIDILEYLSQYTKRILFKPAINAPLLGKDLGNTDVFQNPYGSLILKEYVNYVFHKLSSDDPIYDEATMQGLNLFLLKRYKMHACTLSKFLSLYPDGNIYTCHMLKHPQALIGHVHNLTSIKLKKRQKEINDNFDSLVSNKTILPLYWFSTLQNVCPVQTTSASDSQINIGFPKKEKLFTELFWDEFLKNIISLHKNSEKWNKFKLNLNNFYHIYRGLEIERCRDKRLNDVG